MNCDIDHARFAYLLAAALDEMELTLRAAARLSGCSLRQVQFARSGKPVSAGAVIMLCELACIEPYQLLPAHLLEKREAIRNV